MDEIMITTMTAVETCFVVSSICSIYACTFLVSIVHAVFFN